MLELAMHAFRWLYLDLNSYFASVEQQFHPELRGKPVAVVPMLADTTSVIAASIEAKRCGVKTNTRVADAKKMCPGIVFRTGNHELYARTHQAIIAAVEKVLPVTAVCSIDEIACSLMGMEQTEERATDLALLIKRQIRREAGDYLTCSVGLAPNRYLAKVAADMQKPDGLTKIFPDELPHRLHSLELRDFPGIGPRMEARIRRYGIHTVEQLTNLGVDDLRLIWGGINGVRFFEALRGEDYERPKSETQSIGHSHVLPPEYRNPQKAFLIAQKLLHKAAARLRKGNFWCGELYLSVSFVHEESRYRKSQTLVECCDDLTLVEALRDLWSGISRHSTPLKVSVTLLKLVPDECHTLNLFENPRRRHLAAAVDAVNQRYGKNTLTYASLQGLSKTAAPTRIAFTSIPDFDV